MKILFDPLLIVLLLLLLTSLGLFFSGIIAYPFGLLILSVLIMARLFYLPGKRSDDE
ncbi:MAG: hypothetical protein QNJ69_09815 [Gammaproteobacteria bacterium]|nr:hypothetical protein [Gammaproteobacteria bacterium]